MEKRVKFIINMPREIRRIQSTFKLNGFKLFLVGGAVRDAVLGLTPKDFDLATDALPDDVEAMMEKLGFKTLATGKAFGVINVFTANDEFEIATFREDSKEGDGRRPESVKFTTIEGDVKRRDLTINALFFDIENGEIVDLVGGLDDLSQGIIRTVGPAEDRFAEDRLRILRAIRFAARFGSDLDEDIVKCLKNNSSLSGISSERIRDEFIKGIKTAKSVQKFVKMLFDFKLISEMFLSDMHVCSRVGESRDPIIVLALMLKDFGGTDLIKKLLNAKSFTSDEVKGIVFLNHLRVTTSKLAIELKKEQKNAGLSKEQIREFARLVGMDGIFIDLFLEFELSVSGGQVMEMTGIPAGPELGKLINEMELTKFQELFL